MSCDAWKDTGDCEECRRKKYCREMCSARKRRLKSILDARFIRSEKTGNLYPKLAHLIEQEQEVKKHNDQTDAMAYSIDALRRKKNG